MGTIIYLGTNSRSNYMDVDKRCVKMNEVVKVGLAGLMLFIALWASVFTHAVFLGEMRIEHFVSLLVAVGVLLLVFWKYRDWIHTKPSLREEFSETHAVYGWHAIVLPLLSLFVAAMTMGIFRPGFMNKLVTGEIVKALIVYFFLVYILLLGIAVAFTSKIIIYAEGFWTARGHFSWEDFKRAKMKWHNRLLIFGKDDVFILLNPNKFTKSVKEFQIDSDSSH